MANWIAQIFQFLHDNHIPALFLGTGLGASLSKIVLQVKRILKKNRGNILKTAEEVTEKISECLSQEEEAPKGPSEPIAGAS